MQYCPDKSKTWPNVVTRAHCMRVWLSANHGHTRVCTHLHVICRDKTIEPITAHEACDLTHELLLTGIPHKQLLLRHLKHTTHLFNVFAINFCLY